MSTQNITRRELADITDTSRDTVRRREKEWGIWAFKRRRPGLRQIVYKRHQTLTLLKAKGVIE